MKKILSLLVLLSMSAVSFELGDRVWNDINQNWEQDAGENGLENVTVELHTDKGIKVQSTVTDNQGKYKFLNVELGDYIVKVISPQGLELITSNNIEKWVDKDRNDVDFGLYKAVPSKNYSVGDRVWNDKNENWEQDAGENGLENVTVELHTDKGVKVQSTVTDNQGKYKFLNVELGDYIIKVVPSQGLELVTRNNIDKWIERDRTDIDFGLLKSANNGDVTPPVIVLNGASTIRLKIGDNYEEDGATATDNVDGDVSENIQIDSNVNTAIEGEYTVTYSVIDVAKNSTNKIRKVFVSKKIVKPPVPNGTVSINEILVSNASTNLDPDFKQYSGWIELYNHTNSAIDLGGYALSDDENEPQKWEVPLGTKIEANQYLLIWADKEYENLNALHTNFKLSYKGEVLTLSDSEGNLVDSIKFFKQKGDISCAIVDNKIVYMEPTPNKQNSENYVTSKRTKEPIFSLRSGFYNGTQSIKISQENGAIIYYTVDGSIPTKESKVYTNPFAINTTSVVRAIAFKNGKFVSEVTNRTYLINENITLPVISIGINDEYLHNNDTGIYKNYTQRWMRAGSIEYIKDGKSKFSENIGIRIFGGQSRPFAQKSLAIFAKSRFGAKSIKYPLFPDKNYIKKIKSFVLRNSGNDWGYSMMKDGLVHSIVKDKINIDYQSYQPSVVFINGKYWGIYNIREKTNEDYIEANHGVDSKNIDLLEGKNEANEGSNEAYLDLINYMSDNSLENDIHYNYVESKIDIEEYIDYIITEMYVGNVDWPYNNIKYWKEHSDNAKWRWILYDTDDSFDDEDFDSIEAMLLENGPAEPNPPWATFLFRSLIKNSTFKNRFVSTFNTHLNTTFEPARIATIITGMKDEIKPEIQRHFEKWPRRSPKDWENGSSDSIRALYEFSSKRADVMKRLLSKHFN